MTYNNYILMVFEGQRTEPIIVENLKKHFFEKEHNTIIYALYGNVIYDIYNKVKEDDDLDILALLKEFAQNKDKLQNLSRDDIAEIYLFFDHDAHSHLANDKILEDMLAYFNNETEKGKLYVSYPMVEALKHINNYDDFKELTATITDNTSYKKRVDKEANNKYKQVNKYNKETWLELIKIHTKKVGYIVNSKYSYPEEENPQNTIFIKHKEKYIKPSKEVAILGSFPIFLVDYYGYKILSE